MPADGISLPPKWDFGMSLLGGSKIRLRQPRDFRKGDFRLWHGTAELECPRIGRDWGISGHAPDMAEATRLTRSRHRRKIGLHELGGKSSSARV